MKIGNLEFKDYAAKKPLSISAAGEFITPRELVDKPQLALGSLFTLSTAQQIQLAVERYSIEPEFKIAIFDKGIYTKDEMIEEIREQTNLGKWILRAEIGYCDELARSLPGGPVRQWPDVPSRRYERPFPWEEWPPFRRKKPCIWAKLRTTALFCENTTDGVTTPFANYRIANVHPIFLARGFSVTALTGTQNTRIEFEKRIKSKLVVYGGGVGHGSYTCYTGHWGDHILEVGHYDPSEVDSKAFHFLSCQTGAQLGPDTVNNGAKAYAGYNENFVLQWDDQNTPAVDEFELFARSDSTFDLQMANGATAQEAYDATIQAFNAAIGEVPNQAAATYLTWDRDRLVLHGDPATKILPYRNIKICFPIVRPNLAEALVEYGEIED